MSDRSPILALSTRVVEPRRFTVDDEPYDLLSLEHLGKDDEAEVMAMFARYQRLALRLRVVNSESKGREAARRMRELRERLLTKMTTMPLDVASKLPLSQQVVLLEAAEQEFRGAPSDEEAAAPAEAEGDDSSLDAAGGDGDDTDLEEGEVPADGAP